jgi:AcrR family transcriptional regulator
MARRTAEETRHAILSAARQRLLSDGPDTVRLDDVAADVGVSRQAVLHHFHSREGLMRAVVEQAWTGLFRDLSTLAEAGSLGPATFVDRVDEVARQQGNARLGAWLLLTGEGLPEHVFRDAVADLPHQARASGLAERDARYGLLLVGAALFGDALFGVRLRQALGLPDTEADRADFRSWLAEHLAPGPPGGPVDR